MRGWEKSHWEDEIETYCTQQLEWKFNLKQLWVQWIEVFHLDYNSFNAEFQ